MPAILTRLSVTLATSPIRFASRSKNGRNWTSAVIGSTISVGGVYWFVYAIRNGLPKYWMIPGVLLVATGFTLTTWGVQKIPKLPLPEPDDAEDEHPQQQTIIMSYVENALLAADYSPPTSSCSEGEGTPPPRGNALQRYDNAVRSKLDSVRLTQPVYNKTQKLYIQMFFEILQEIKLVLSYKPSSEAESCDPQEVDRWGRRVRSLLCVYMPKIDMSHETRLGLFEHSERYSLGRISLKRLTNAFNILMECNGDLPSNEDEIRHGDREASEWLASIQKFVRDDIDSDV